VRRFVIYTPQQIFLGWLNRGGWHVQSICMGKKRNNCRVLVRRPEGKRLEELGVGESVTLECSTRNGMGGRGLDSFGSEWDQWLLNTVKNIQVS
jgi:hypothetical protein